MPQFERIIGTVDAHAAGEPLRVIVSGLPPIPGTTMLDRRRFMKENYDCLRKLLMLEPRGHAGMYGCVVTPPATDDGDFGVLFLHNEGYSTMCGHGIIAVTKVMIEMGMISPPDGGDEIRIDSPAGRIAARAHMKNGRVERVSFTNVPSFVHTQNLMVPVDGVGEIPADIAFGGAFYAFVDAEHLGITLDLEYLPQLVDTGMAIKYQVMDMMDVVHPTEPGLRGIYGTIITGPVSADQDANLVSRNLTVFADAQVDRSPTGTGTAARIALLHRKGLLPSGAILKNHSIINTVFEGRMMDSTIVGTLEAVIPEISGSAHITAMSQFVLEPGDPSPEGFRITGA